MSRSRSLTHLIAVILVFGCPPPGSGLPTGQKLYVNGLVVSNGVIVKNGVAYAPISDLAKALAMTVSKRPDGYAMARPGGANQVQGLAGKVGDDLFNGTYRFKVTGVTRGTKYVTRFTGSPTTLEAPAGKEIVAIACRLKSGIKEPILLSPFGRGDTALTDDAEHSYEQLTGVATDIPNRGVRLLPGAAVEFALTFWVPPGTVLKDLVYQVDDGVHKPNPDFRISLK